jgi:hypothetical protein
MVLMLPPVGLPESPPSFFNNNHHLADNNHHQSRSSNRYHFSIYCPPGDVLLAPTFLFSRFDFRQPAEPRIDQAGACSCFMLRGSSPYLK